MIHGHCFHYRDGYAKCEEHILDHTKPFKEVDALTCVDVVESGKTSSLNRFSHVSPWMLWSGRMCRVCSDVEFQESGVDDSWALEIKDVVTLLWEAEQRKIVYVKGREHTPERMRFWIYHTFFPMVIELSRRFRMLHVGAVEINGKAVLFSAFAFGGKSTMTDYFLRQGHGLFSDDSLGVQCVDGAFRAVPSYPFHRPYRQVESLGDFTDRFVTQPCSIHAVFSLEKSAPDAMVNITALRGIEKFKVFHYSTFIDFDFMKRERLAFFGEMAKQVPAYKVTVPWDLERLPDVYAAIMKQVSSA